MLGVFAEFERSIIQERIRAGIARARRSGTKSGKPIGRNPIPAEKVKAIRTALAAGGKGQIKIARELGVAVGTVNRIAKEMRGAPVTARSAPIESGALGDARGPSTEKKLLNVSCGNQTVRPCRHCSVFPQIKFVF